MKKSIAIFGGGPSALAMASFLDTDYFNVTLYEQNKTCGRKFLVAGKGGFNLTYAEPLDQLIARYIPSYFLKGALKSFTNTDFRNWLSDIGIETFVGSSNRVFPIKKIKPIQVLDAIMKHVQSRGVDIKYQMEWKGWSSNGLPVVNDREEVKADYVVFAFGGASWKITGSNGRWAPHFKSKEISIKEFQSSNCAFAVDWAEELIKKIEGKPIKNIAVSCGEKTQTGELVATQFGLEGNAIYPLSHEIRHQLHMNGHANITIDFKPIFEPAEIQIKISRSKARNISNLLKHDLKLDNVQVALIKSLTTKEAFLHKDQIGYLIKNITVDIRGVAPIDEAISTVGGVSLEELTDTFELKKMKNTFCIGEMVDWDAPTGGYLLQGCFSMGVFLAHVLGRKRSGKVNDQVAQ